MLYEKLRSALESQTDLSMESLIRNLDKNYNELDEQYAGEIMVGLMFAASLAIERSASAAVAKRITDGMKTEFDRHLGEQGASDLQRAEWSKVIESHLLVFRQCIDGYTGFEPPWKLGRQFYWNIISREDYTAMSVKIATLFLLAARDMCQEVLNEFGPLVTIAGNT
jgi:hypothetical protein